MDSKDGKKKESIDDILSDLNGLLNKMPSILDGIKMPELPTAASEPRREAKAEPPAADSDKTMILPAFSDLPEGAAAPAEKTGSPEPEPVQEPAPQAAAEKTVILEAFSGLPDGAAIPQEQPEIPAVAPVADAAKLVPQSLGDFMFGEEAQKEEKAPSAAPVELSGIPLAQPSTVEPAPEQPEAVLPGERPEPAPQAEILEVSSPEPVPEVRPALKPYDTTRDFGIPDIDALMQLSSGEEPWKQEAAPVEPEIINREPEAALFEPEIIGKEPEAAPAEPEIIGQEPEAAIAPEVPQAAAPADIEPGMDELAEFERQLKAAAEPEGGNVEKNIQPEEENPATPQPEEIQVAPEQEQALPAPAAGVETGFEAFTIEPSKSEGQPAQEAVEPLSAEPAAQAEQAQGGQTGPAAEVPQPIEPAIEAPHSVFSEQQAEAVIEPQFVQPAVEEPVLQVQPETLPGAQQAQPAGGIELQAQAEIPPAAEPQASQGIELEPPSSLLSAQTPAARSGDETLVVAPPPGTSGDETLVVAPPPEAAGGEDKTVIFDAGATLGETSRSQAGDLASLAAKQVPEGIPAERVKSVMFLYSAEDKALCATVMAELDAICLRSATKPMFIKRAAVRECDPELNANFLHQSVADIGAIGMICVGNIPQEKVYEIENAFSASGGFFRHYDASSFNHSSALDLVTDLILR